MKIFIVDDELDLQEVYKGMLQDTGWEVETSSDVTKLSPKREDIVVLDLVGTNARLIANNAYKTVIISGNSRIKVDLEKPFTQEQLIKAIKSKAAA